MKRRFFLQGAGGLGVLAYAGCDGAPSDVPDEPIDIDDSGGPGTFPGLSTATIDTMEALTEEVLADTPWADRFGGAFVTFGEFLNEFHTEYPAAAETMRQVTEASLPFMRLVADVKKNPPATQEELEETVFPELYTLTETLSGMESTIDDMLQEIDDKEGGRPLRRHRPHRVHRRHGPARRGDAHIPVGQGDHPESDREHRVVLEPGDRPALDPAGVRAHRGHQRCRQRGPGPARRLRLVRLRRASATGDPEALGQPHRPRSSDRSRRRSSTCAKAS
ncbi:MAG TPA: hypothetical protein QGF58_10940 [Myxococcota bacterium]|nr:hypothetical protein [Myxococcota bacterium]